MKKLLALLFALVLTAAAAFALAEDASPIAIKALILPKFESGEMAGDFPGEAQYYYEGYCMGGSSMNMVSFLATGMVSSATEYAPIAIKPA